MSIEENGSRVESSREDHTGTSTFDSAARGLADGSVSRGKALRMLAASLFGGALVAAPAAVAVAAPKPGGTGCSKPGEIRVNGKCQCNTAEGLVTCGANQRCVDPNACGGGQHVDPDTCKCVCDNPGETLCPGTGRCISNTCPEGAVLETSGESCSCQCRNQDKEIVNTPTGARCVCKQSITCGVNEQVNPDTCQCECATGFQRCRNSTTNTVACVPECTTGQVLRNCVCIAEVTCGEAFCPAGCCVEGVCQGGDLDTACGTGGVTCADCAQQDKVCVNGECVECRTNAQCAAGQACVNNVCGACTTDAQCGAGQVCSAAGACVQCTTNTQCAAGQACVNNVCGACTTDAQCGAGQVCSSGVCVTAPTPTTCTPACTGTNAFCCPAGTKQATKCRKNLDDCGGPA